MRKTSYFKFANPSGEEVWKARVHTGQHPNGEPRFTQVTAKSKKDVTDLAQKREIEARQGALAPEGKEHFESFALRWLEQTKGPTVRESTAADYRYKLDRYIFPVFGKRPLKEIKSRDITAFLKDLKNKGMANYSISAIRQVLNAVMKEATVHDYISKNPVANTPIYKKTRRDTVLVKEPWTKSEALQVLQAIQVKPVELFGRLALYLGLRKSEILGLQWADFDLENARLTINRSMREVSIYQPDGSRRTEMVEQDPKTETSRRTLVLTEPILESLLRHKDQIADKGLVKPNSWVFTTRFGTPQRPATIAAQLNKVLDSHNIRRIRIHDMRHTAVVLGLESGMPIEAISQGAGHSRLDTTKSIYAPYCQTLADTFSNGLSNYLTGDAMEHQLRQLLEEETSLPAAGKGGGGVNHPPGDSYDP